MTHREITLSRECKVILIPSGDESVLPAGSPVIITQSLGGTYTVATQTGLARIAEADADALGIEPEAKPAPAAAAAAGTGGDVAEDDVWAQLKNVYDPEIPVNIVDLGLVYDLALGKSESGATTVTVKMTLTAPGCGMGPTIAADARSRILTVPGVESAEVELVWSPPWNQGMISEAGRMKLGLV
ncbi:MAG: putative Fe-S cluster assembly protein SufT [Chthoniobacterales bacterium]|nr:putative Fe-S cluster assembly protein SufT [Chthoniobacterales bacterium]